MTGASAATRYVVGSELCQGLNKKVEKLTRAGVLATRLRINPPSIDRALLLATSRVPRRYRAAAPIERSPQVPAAPPLNMFVPYEISPGRDWGSKSVRIMSLTPACTYETAAVMRRIRYEPPIISS